MEKRKSKSPSRNKDKKVVDLTSYRKDRDEERRRRYERVLFNRVLGVYSFAEKAGLHHVDVIDVSISGMRFREETPEIPLRVGQKIALRFYFTQNSFLRLVVDIVRVQPFADRGRNGLEYGCELDQSTRSYSTLKQLIVFMSSYSEIACEDHAPPMIWF